MKRLILNTLTLLTIIYFLISGFELSAQNLNLNLYQEFLDKNKNISSTELFNIYSPGQYMKSAGSGILDSKYFNNIKDSLNLTDNEIQLVNQHGFVVSDRLQYGSFWMAFGDIYGKDLPVFFSTDALLQALHSSYDEILKSFEYSVIIPRMKDMLIKYHDYVLNLMESYGNNPVVMKSIKDYDVYFTVARNLIENQNIPCILPENDSTVQILLNYISELQPVNLQIFSDTPHFYDFSQMTIRGHYTESKELSYYFKSMIWLGRTEFYLIPPSPASVNPVEFKDIQRQIIDAVLINEATDRTGASESHETIDKLIKLLVGESDNVQLKHISEIMSECVFTSALDFCDSINCIKFQDILSQKPYVDQKILSQMIWADPFNTVKIKPASAFLLFGQRFIIDSYITGSVVHDKVENRMLPSSLDVLFALGNNAASDLLKSELERYKYSDKLAGLRYLVDSYDDSFWYSSFYNGWLGSLRKLNPPADKDREKLPRFMQTAAWWQEKMNTQLASWAQLRHDNLLYAKQSYSGMNGCSYPEGYVEPYPEFYKSVGYLASNTIIELEDFFKDKPEYNIIGNFQEYFKNLESVCSKLESISGKELNHACLSNEERKFLLGLFTERNQGCVTEPDGWFSGLFYSSSPDKGDYVVVDLHTAPTDADGNMVGWVWHAGTGQLNTAIVVAESCTGEKTAYCGPVMSYHEYTSTNFKRLTDEEWKTMILLSDNSVIRSEWTKLYMSDNSGNNYSGDLVSLPLGIVKPDPPITITDYIVEAYPNPVTNNSVLIYVSIPQSNTTDPESKIQLSIYNEQGNLVTELYNGILSAGRNYLTRWEALDNNNNRIQSGTYYLHLTCGNKTYTRKIVVVN